MPIFSGSKVSLVSLVIRKTTTGGLDLAWRILYKLEFSEIYSPLQLLIFNFLGYKKGIQMLMLKKGSLGDPGPLRETLFGIV